MTQGRWSPMWAASMDQVPGPPLADYHGTSDEAQAVAAWHDETHTGAFLHCREQPCSTVRHIDKGDPKS